MARKMDREPLRFFDGGSIDGKQPPNTAKPIGVQLRWVLERKPKKFLFWALKPRPVEQFIMERRIGYRDRKHQRPFIVPDAGDEAFRTDLTSVPDLFTWLVPRTGYHLPAALLHDGLVYDPGKERSYDGPDTSRVQADRILRDAMFDLGTGWLRRWLTWTAVTLATVWRGVDGGFQKWYYRAAVFGTICLIVALGLLATLDVFDWWNVLPWMDNREWYWELAYGAGAAVVIPAVLSILWVRLWRAGVIAGIALAFLLHVTVALAILTGVLQMVEFLTFTYGRRRAAYEKLESHSADVPRATTDAVT